MKKRYKIIFIAVAIMLLIVVIMGILIIKYSGDGILGDYTPAVEERVTTEIGDEFSIKVEKGNFPDVDNFVTILDSKNKERIAFFVVHGEFNKSKVITLLKTSKIRCYQYSTELIYRIDGGKFESINIGEVSETKPEENPTFVAVAQALVAKKEWLWIKVCGKLLLKADDNDMKQTLERYASNNFTPEELEANKKSEIKKEDIVVFAKQTLEQK